MKPFALTFLLAGLLAMPMGCSGRGVGLGDRRGRLNGPEGRFTILLRVFHDRNHRALAEQWRKSLGQSLRWKDLYVVTSGEHSELYWGRFKSRKLARPALKRAQKHRTHSGTYPFNQAFITVARDSGTASAPWDLRNCPGAYSLLIAVYQDVPKEGYVGRHKFAVDYCRELREKGHEAYFHHGPSSSSVTVGAFGRDAFLEKQVTVPKGKGHDPYKVTRVIPVDRKLIALQKRFPLRSWNGRYVDDVLRDPKGREVRRRSPASVPIHVPGKGPR